MWKPRHINAISSWRSVRAGHGHSSHAYGHHRYVPRGTEWRGKEGCTGNYHSCMPGIQTLRAQPGICEEALAVTARLAEPPSRFNTCQGKACSASWLPDASAKLTKALICQHHCIHAWLHWQWYGKGGNFMFWAGNVFKSCGSGSSHLNQAYKRCLLISLYV